MLVELSLVNWAANGANVWSTNRIYRDNKLPWFEFEGDLNTVYDFQRSFGEKNSNPKDASYLLPEDTYDEFQNPENFDEDVSEERLNRNDRSLLPEYRNLCDTVTRKVELKNDPSYEYQPPHYHEVYCKSYSSLIDDQPPKSIGPSKQKCAHPSFHCVQRSRTLFLVRRRWDNECWEPITKVVASGCDCMWPVSTLGDISIHY